MDIKSSARKELVEKVIENFKNNNLFWEKSWSFTPKTPYNSISKTEYKGLNKAILTFSQLIYNFKDPRWLTFKQAKDEGLKVKKGEKATLIEVFKVYDKLTKKEVDREYKKELEEKYTKKELIKYYQENIYSFVKSYPIFNAEQIENMKSLEEDKDFQNILDEKNEKLDKLIKNYEVPILENNKDRAYYNPVFDNIVIPKKEHFKSIEGFYSTLLHELGHSTGHETRLNRKTLANFDGFGSENYAKEELIAEFTSLFVTQEFNILNKKEFDNSSAYLKGWLKVLENDPNFLFEAIKQADDASNYLISFAEKEKEIKEEREDELVVRVDYTDSSFLRNKYGATPFELPFYIAEREFKNLNYLNKVYGYSKTGYTLIKNNEEIYQNRFDLGSEPIFVYGIKDQIMWEFYFERDVLLSELKKSPNKDDEIKLLNSLENVYIKMDKYENLLDKEIKEKLSDKDKELEILENTYHEFINHIKERRNNYSYSDKEWEEIIKEDIEYIDEKYQELKEIYEDQYGSKKIEDVKKEDIFENRAYFNISECDIYNFPTNKNFSLSEITNLTKTLEGCGYKKDEDLSAKLKIAFIKDNEIVISETQTDNLIKFFSPTKDKTSQVLM